MKKTIMILLLISYIFVNRECFGFWVWSPQTGKWINPNYHVFDTPQEQFDWAGKYFEAKDYDRAILEFKKLINKFSNSKLAPEAKFYIGQCEEQLHKYYKAFKTYQSVIDVYPLNERLDEIVERQYLIGEIYLKRKKYETAKEIFEKILVNSPYSKFADVVQYKAGICFLKMKEFTNAQEAFDKIAGSYSYSPYLDDAGFQSAFCSYKISSSVKDYDMELLQKGIDDLEYFLRRFQTSEYVPRAESLLAKLNQEKAKKLFAVAYFYEKQKKTYAAVKYYEEVVYSYENTTWGEKAKNKLKNLRNK